MIDDDFSVIFPAAGTGSRFGGSDKLLTDIGGTTVLQRAVALFTKRRDVRELLVVTAPDRFDCYRKLLAEVLDGKPLHLVAGGTARWESVLHGLRAASIKSQYVAIHDAARPLTPTAVIDAAFAAARMVGAGVPVVAEPATLKRVDESRHIVGTVSRTGIFQAQTPQCFARQALLRAYEKLLNAGELQDITD
ncbi:MAG: NTP transferase domain-containing protein, partial [Phycisphaerae bacterium]|nr:NTP transferase domain-containing protein [Phycisphaerae bacterium]